jgi:hypothetical protein
MPIMAYGRTRMPIMAQYDRTVMRENPDRMTEKMAPVVAINRWSPTFFNNSSTNYLNS